MGGLLGSGGLDDDPEKQAQQSRKKSRRETVVLLDQSLSDVRHKQEAETLAGVYCAGISKTRREYLKGVLGISCVLAVLYVGGFILWQLERESQIALHQEYSEVFEMLQAELTPEQFERANEQIPPG